MLNFSMTPCFAASALEGGCPSLSSHKLELLTQRDGVLFGHPMPQLSSQPGKQLPGALHPYAAGRGAVSSASGTPPENRGVRRHFNPQVFVTGHFATQLSFIRKGFVLTPSGHILVGQADHQGGRGAPG